MASILEQAGITEKEERVADGVEEDVAEEGTPSETQADSITLLEKQLEEAVENEDYELAARLRDRIDKLNHDRIYFKRDCRYCSSYWHTLAIKQ